MDDNTEAGCGLIMLALGLVSAAAWLTHVIVCIRDGEWGFLIAGALLAPIAVVHGIGCWFGAW